MIAMMRTNMIMALLLATVAVQSRLADGGGETKHVRQRGRRLWQASPFNLDDYLNSNGGSSSDFLAGAFGPFDFPDWPCGNDATTETICEDRTLTICYCVQQTDVQSDTCTPGPLLGPDPTGYVPCDASDVCYLDMPVNNYRLFIACVGFQPFYPTFSPTVSPAPSISQEPTAFPTTPAPTTSPTRSPATLAQLSSSGLLVLTQKYLGPVTENDFHFFYAGSSGTTINDPKLACPGFNPNALEFPAGGGPNFELEIVVLIELTPPIGIVDPDRYDLRFTMNDASGESSMLLVNNLFGAGEAYLLFCIQAVVINGQNEVLEQRETAVWLDATDKSLVAFEEYFNTELLTYSPTSSPTQSPTTSSPTGNPTSAPSSTPTSSPTPVLGRCIYVAGASNFGESLCVDSVSQGECETLASGSNRKWLADTSCPGRTNRMRCPPRRWWQRGQAAACKRLKLKVPCQCYNSNVFG